MSPNELKGEGKTNIKVIVQKLQERGVKAQICKRPRPLMKL